MGHRVGPEDVELVVEVSAATRQYDLGEKARAYAAAGVVEYWVVDLLDAVVHVHREPAVEGYRTVTTTDFGDPVESLAVLRVVVGRNVLRDDEEQVGRLPREMGCATRLYWLV